jgi:hypothetical protein
MGDGHQRELALFALPAHVECNGGDDDNDSNAASIGSDLAFRLADTWLEDIDLAWLRAD